jgi:hypothetical protein
LDVRLSQAKRAGQSYLDVNAGDLHGEVGVYPRPGHRMPVCCHAMRQAMKTTDRIVAEPPKGNRASLTVRYMLA